MSELKYPIWQMPLQEAILELDLEELAEKIRGVEILISERIRTFSSDTDHKDERAGACRRNVHLAQLEERKIVVKSRT
jgi:hypothetical protein